ncbi:unnamed protein product, partial [Vitis vinifera]|uniref:Uncharacterized protein n=1 Tax=Vitis vinifera TaxID=29760 RepID=D7TRK6_VITVI
MGKTCFYTLMCSIQAPKPHLFFFKYACTGFNLPYLETPKPVPSFHLCFFRSLKPMLEESMEAVVVAESSPMCSLIFLNRYAHTLAVKIPTTVMLSLMTLHLVDNMRNTGNLRQVPQFLCREIAYANDSSLAKIISASIAFHVLGISDWVRFSDLKPTEPFFIQTDQWIRYKSTQHILRSSLIRGRWNLRASLLQN